ncbi:MAG: hypothetical protein IKL18_06560 [Oscillospiraceae bacterium]|nr:hypothetical protein [Oscillospiraceae bacterium]
MKKLFVLVLALLMLCSCGDGETSMELLPLEMSLKSASESTVVVSVKNLGENRIEIVDGASLYKTENKEEKCVGDIRFCDYKLEYAVLPGQETEWVFDVEKLFGKLPKGEYRMIFGGFDYEVGYNGNWWKEIEFVI